MRQSRRGSLLEAFTNVCVGYSINLVANAVIFPAFGWHIGLMQNLELGLVYTAISIARSYAIRRLFDHRQHRSRVNA